MKFLRSLLSNLQRRWVSWRWRKHLPQPLTSYERFLLDEAPHEVLREYLTHTKGWSGSAPMTVSVAKAELRHWAMRKQLQNAPKHLLEETPEFEEARKALYGDIPEPKYLNGCP